MLMESATCGDALMSFEPITSALRYLRLEWDAIPAQDAEFDAIPEQSAAIDDGVSQG